MMLLDDIKDLPSSSWGRFLRPEIAREWRKDALRARPYVFDRAASRKLGEFIRDCPDIVVDQMEFAKPPFPITYIEVEIDAVHEGIGSMVSVTGDDADWKLGFLCNEEGSIKSVARNRSRPDTIANVIGYMDANQVDSSHLAEDLHETREMVLLGSSYHKLDPVRRRRFASSHIVEALCDDDYSKTDFATLVSGHVGELRVYIAALLLLQQKRVVNVGSAPWERKISRGKLRTFMAHSVVTVMLDGPVEIRRQFTITDRASPRAHEVPAHYCHRHGDRGCEHTWVARVDEENHWDCPKCGRFRYLRRHHMRGDGSKGFVTREYDVTTQDERHG